MKIILTNPVDGIQPTIDNCYFYGIWPTKNSTIIYKVYMYINVLLFGVIYIGTLSGAFFKMTDLENSTEIIYVSCSDIALGIKLAFLLRRRKKIENLVESMKKYLYADSDDVEEKIMISNGIYGGRRIFLFVKYVFILSGALATSVPLFHKERILMFPSFFPFNPKVNQIVYWMVYLYQAFGIFIQIQWNACLDTIPSSILSILGGYYEALGYNLRKIGWSDKVEGLTQPVGVVKTPYEYKQEEVRLKILITKYTNITRITEMISYIFSEMIFSQFCLGGVILCTSAFQLSILSFRADLAKFIFSLNFILSMLTEIFIPCYFGNKIIVKSDILLNQIYNSNWLQGSPKYRKDVYIFMERLKRSTQISAGRFFSLSLQAFTSIINFSYSAYTLLRSFN